VVEKYTGGRRPPSGEASKSSAGRRGELRQTSEERVLIAAICRADGHNKPSVHVIDTGLAIMLEQFDSLVPSIYRNASFVAVGCVDGTGRGDYVTHVVANY
jgi:hypothetical protein